MKYCKHCGINHPNTYQFWYKIGTSLQCKEYQRFNRRKNAERRKEARRLYSEKWRKENPERIKELQKNHYEKNKHKIIERNYRYAMNRKKIDINYRLTITLRQRLNKALKGNYKNGSAVMDLGCSIKDFKSYIEAKFQPGMTWDNYGRAGWHIDHIKPISKFDLTNPVQFKQAVHYTNLQPLWAVDNIRKGVSPWLSVT